jgi:hypothetical protein
VVIEFDKSVIEPDKAMIDRLEARIMSAYVGVRRTGKPIILSPGVTMKPLTTNPEEMAYVESADQVKNWIFASHGTGQSIVGLVEQTSFNNVWGARANFYSNTITPMVKLLGELFTEKVAARFDKDLVVYWPDTAPVDPDLELREIESMLKNNVLTINEVCAMKGYELKEWGDEPLDKIKADWMAATKEQMPGEGTPPAQAGESPLPVASGPHVTSPQLENSPLYESTEKEAANSMRSRMSVSLAQRAAKPKKNGSVSHGWRLH